jgi:hypothetical protein
MSKKSASLLGGGPGDARVPALNKVKDAKMKSNHSIKEFFLANMTFTPSRRNNRFYTYLIQLQ